MPELTNAQRSTVELRGENILVSAAAGSGKTFVLTKRIVKMIAEEQADVRDMLLATFTNAAAAQMKRRLYDALSASMDEEGCNQGHIRRQLLYLNSADIGTLHAFCIGIVRSYFYVVDVPCDFKIIDEAEDVLLRAEVLERIIEERYAAEADDGDFLTFAEMYTTSKSTEKLHRVILNAYDYAMSRPEGLDWLKKEIAYYKICDRPQESKWMEILRQKAQEDIENARSEMAYALKRGRVCLEEPALSVLEKEYENIALVAEAARISFEAFCTAYEQYLAPKSSRFSPGKSDEAQEVKKIRANAKKIISREVEKLARYSLQKAAAENIVLARVLNVMYEVIKQFDEAYREQKQRKKVITFNDSEQYCLKILNDEDIRLEIAGRYAHIFIDEYQDISLLQEAILKRVSNGRNLFMVGDVKQSIYRFRLADATIFNEKYAQYGAEDGGGKLIVLNQNFRSSDGVIDLINAIFERMMNKATADIDYDENARLVRGREECAAGGKAEIFVFEDGRERVTEDSSALMMYQDAQTEALNTVGIIRELLESEIYDRRQAMMRKAEYGDIVILLASPAVDAACYTDILTQHNIPVYYDAPRGYFENMEVELMLNLLKLIDNKKQDIALLSVMRAPFYDFSMEEFMRIRKASSTRFFHEAVEEYMLNKKDKLSDKIKKMNKQIDDYKACSRHVSVYELLKRIYRKTGYDEYVSLLVDGSARRANLDQLLDVALRYEKSGTAGLFGFIQFVTKVRQAQTEVATATQFSAENAVRIMSIHKSKGLEFPIVILGRTSKRYNMDDVKKDMIFHKTCGIAPEYIDYLRGYRCNSMAKMAARHLIKNELAAEYMRLLYVALSRAEEKLVITALIKDSEEQKALWRGELSDSRILSMHTFIDWVMAAVYHTPNYTRLCDLHIDKAAKSMVRATAQHKRQFYEQLSQKLPEIDALTEERLNWVYPFEKSTKIAQRLTVSELKESGMGETAYRYASLSGEENNRFDALRQGVLTHYILQTVSLEALKSGADFTAVLDEHIRKLQFEGVLNEEEAGQIEVRKLAAFFASEAGQMILDADSVKREAEFYYLLEAGEVYDGVEPGEKIYLQGVIDCIVQKGEETVIMDYKTDRYTTKERRAVLVGRYRRQLYYYKKAYEEVTQKAVAKCLLCFINTGEAIALDL